MKLNRRMEIGIWLLALYFILNRYGAVSDLIQGMVLGIAAGFILLGLLSERAWEKIKAWKSFKS